MCIGALDDGECLVVVVVEFRVVDVPRRGVRVVDPVVVLVGELGLPAGGCVVLVGAASVVLVAPPPPVVVDVGLVTAGAVVGVVVGAVVGAVVATGAEGVPQPPHGTSVLPSRLRSKRTPLMCAAMSAAQNDELVPVLGVEHGLVRVR